MIANITSQLVRMVTSLRIRDAPFSMLCNLVLENVVQEMYISKRITLSQMKIELLAYSDDIALLLDGIETMRMCMMLSKPMSYGLKM